MTALAIHDEALLTELGMSIDTASPEEFARGIRSQGKMKPKDSRNILVGPAPGLPLPMAVSGL